MKKLILLTATLIISTVAFSQVPGFTLGPKIGASFSKFTTDKDQIKEEMKNTFFFGAFARIGKKIYLQPELLIMSRNGTLKNEAEPGSSNSLKIKTLDIPMLVGFQVLNLKVMNLRAMAGPVASIVVNKSVSSDNWNNPITRDDIRDANWGLQFGAGVDVLILTLDVRYEIGLNNISSLDGFDLKNNMFTVGLGIKIL